MAFFHTQFCVTCLKETAHTNNKCNVCARNEKLKKLKEWSEMPLDAKFDHLLHRIENLERGTIKYG